MSTPIADGGDGSVRDQLEATRVALAQAVAEMERMREASAITRQLVDILREVTGELSAAEIYRVLTRRVGRALEVTHCSVVLARAGDTVGRMVSALESPVSGELEMDLQEYPEITAALEAKRPLLIDYAATPSAPTAGRPPGFDGREGRVRSTITVPFSIDAARGGVLCIHSEPDERTLTAADTEFAEFVMRAVEVAIRRAHTLETAQADNQRLEALATTDPLTRMLNRRALLDRLSIELDRAKRFSATLTLLLVDVDYFKAVNDTAGHLAGDDVLRQLAALLEDAVRRVDIVARYGGDEFVVILPETISDGALVFAERVRERVATHEFGVGGDRQLHLTISTGIASFPMPQVESIDDLFARADEALYRAKSGGRNRVCR